MQNGDQIGPGSYITIIVVAWLLLIVSLMNRRVTVRHDVARRFNEMGYLTSAPGRRSRIAFLPSHSGCWIMPFVKHFVQNSAEGSADVVCIDNYGDVKFCDLKDDQWLRLNVAIEEKESGLAPGAVTLKVFLTDYFTLDLPSNSVDVVVIPTGAGLPILQLACKTEEEKESRLTQILSEVNRVLRPGGRLISTSLTFNSALWEKAVARSGLAVPVQPEEPVPTYLQYLPFVLRRIAKAMRPDPADQNGHGTGRKGWIPTSVWWTVLPARLHMAVGTYSGAAHTPAQIPSNSIDVIPLPSGSVSNTDPDVPTNPPIFYKSSLSDAEELDFFPPGRQFRVAELLTAFNTLCWVAVVVTLWFYMQELQVPSIMPYGRQVSAFVMEIVLLLPPLIIFNFDARREVAKTKGLVIPYAVLRNKVLRTWASQRFYFLTVVLVSLIFWVPYLILDYCLIEYGHKTQEQVQTYNFIISVAISLFFIFGGKRAATYFMQRLKKSKEAEAEAEAEDMQRESVATSVELGSEKATKSPMMV